MEPPTVRRCHRCHAPAVIVVNRWSAYLLGVLPMPYEGRTDHQCQACGARFTLRPLLLPWFGLGVVLGSTLLSTSTLALIGAPIALNTQGAAATFAVLVVASVCLGAGLASLWFLAGPQVHAWRNPVVPGAPVPPLRYGPPDPLRRCWCGVLAPRIGQTAFLIVQIPGGRTDTHRCPSCGHTFAVPNRLALATSAAMTLSSWAIMVFLGLLLPLRDLRGDHIFVLGVLGFGGLIGAIIGAIGGAMRRRHPRP